MRRKKKDPEVKRIYFWGAIFFMLIFPEVNGQEVSSQNEESLFNLFELLIDENDDEHDYSVLLEHLESLKENPINLNKASAEKLRELSFLSEIQITNLLNHIHNHGELLNIQELQSIEGFTLETIKLLYPFVLVKNKPFDSLPDLYAIGKQSNNELLLKFQQILEPQKGYIPNSDQPPAYYGSPYRLFCRYRFTYYNRISFGLTAEKDPGEEFFKGSQSRGFDFYSGHLILRDFGFLSKLIIGDYHAQFGQGINFHSGRAFGKNMGVLNISKKTLGFRQHTSADEYNFLRGIALSTHFKYASLSFFLSSKKIDANVIETDSMSGDVIAVSSLYQNGLHRSVKEISNRNSIRETVYGLNLNYEKRNFSAGITASYLKLGAELKKERNPYNQFEFSGNENINAGADYNLNINNINLFGEFSLSSNSGLALLNGAVVCPDPRFSFSLVYRNYSRSFYSPYSSGPGENTRLTNEKGLLTGLQVNISATMRLTAYADHFIFPWLKYRTYMPSRGWEYMLQYDYRTSGGFEAYVRFRIKNKPLNSSIKSSVTCIEDVIKQSIRVHFSYFIQDAIQLRNRIELSNFHSDLKKENGFLIYQDIIFKPKDSRYSFCFRYSLFDTGSFDSRIYTYENDVLYAYSSPFFHGKGTRAYLVIRYNLKPGFDIYARASKTSYASQHSIGSGHEEISGGAKTEIKVQLRLKF